MDGGAAAEEGTPTDMGTVRGPDQGTTGEAGPEVDRGSGQDMSLEDMSDADAGGELDMGADQGADEDMEPEDMGSADPFEGRPIGQCAVSADCPDNPNGKICNRLLPGGSCGGCGNDNVCDDECFVGTCVTTCGSDTDCAPGLRCTSAGRCGAVRCTNGTCPVPLFGCSESGLCQRVDCSGGETCPADTTCVSGVCIEDRAMP